MSMIAGHPAVGLGLYMPGWYSVPENPIQQGVHYTPRIGEIIGASFVVPQNPIKDYMKGQINQIGRDPNVTGMVNGVSLGACGCGGGCGSCGGGMGDINISADIDKIKTDFTAGNYSNILTDTIASVPIWAIAAGVALLMFAGGEKHSYYGRGRRAARAAAGAF